MTRFADVDGGILSLEMRDLRTGCPWERDFFDCGGLPYDPDADAYTVPDVLYLVDYATDYMEARGDFLGVQPGKEQGTLFYTCSKEA